MLALNENLRQKLTAGEFLATRAALPKVTIQGHVSPTMIRKKSSELLIYLNMPNIKGLTPKDKNVTAQIKNFKQTSLISPSKLEVIGLEP